MTAEDQGQPEVAAPRRVVSTASAGRALAVVEALLDDAARSGERAVTWTRIVLSALMLVVWPILTWEELKTGRVSLWVTLFASPVALLISLWILRYLRRHALKLKTQIAAVTLDVVLIATVMVPYPFSPAPDYNNVTNMNGMALLVLGVVTGGVRLSRRVSLYATGMYLALLAVLGVIDYSLGHVRSMPLDYTLYTLYLLAAGVLAYIAASRTRALVLRAATQTLEAERTRSLLGAYVSEEVAAASLAQDELHLGGQRQDVAILFTDLRGFTTFSEGLSPEELVTQLNRYLDAMVTCVRAHGGVVDKYIGDSIMAVFGAPTPAPDDAARALRAAASMREALVSHNEDRRRRGLPPLAQGIGAHFGPVVAGNVGTTERAAYTVIGDAVNLASRLESATKEQGTDVLFSRDLVEAASLAPGDAPLPAVVPHGTLVVRGREQPVEVFTLASPADAEGRPDVESVGPKVVEVIG